MMLEYKAEDTICRNCQTDRKRRAGEPDPYIKGIKDTEVDMFTTVFIGNEQTQEMDGHMVTPRGYRGCVKRKESFIWPGSEWERKRG